MALNPAVKAYVDAVNAQFDVIEPAVDGVADDIAFVKEQLEEINNRPSWGPEDQVALDAALTRLTGTTTKITTLDAQTSRPTPPPPPPT
jgi:hypothetical protein